MTSVLALYINLDRSDVRRAHMEEQLTALGFPFERFAALDGSTLETGPAEIDPDHFAKCHGRLVRPGEIGCYLSHIRALERFLQSEADYGLIFEDDAEISPDLREILDEVVQRDKLQDWDFLKLQTRRNTFQTLCQPIKDDYSLGICYSRSTGATAYMVTRQGAQKMVERLLPMETPWDHAFDRPHFLGLRFKIVYPYPVTCARLGSSTIETSKPIKLSGLSKLPALWWRSKSEIGRLVWSVKDFLVYKLSRSES